MKNPVTTCLFLFIQLFCFSSYGQEHPSIFAKKSTYERLIQTKKEYNKAIAIGDSAKIAELSYQLGKRYQEINDYNNTLFFFRQAIHIRKSIGTSSDLGKIYQRLGEWYFHRRELNDAEKYLHHALQLFTTNITTNAHRVGVSFRILGDIHKQRGSVAGISSSLRRAHNDSALDYYKKTSELAHKYNLPEGSALAFYQISSLFLTNSENKKSIEYAQKAFELFQKLGQSRLTVDSAIIIAQNYVNLNKLNLAKKWLDTAEAIAQRSEELYPERISTFNLLKEYYERKGDWKNAYHYQTQTFLHAINDQATSQKSVMEGAWLLHESEQREAQLQDQKEKLELALSKEERRKQTWLIIFISLLLVTSGIASTIYYRLFVRYKLVSQQNEELLKEHSHRIKNNLQSISDLLTLQLYQLSDPGAVQALEESLARINAMSLIHRRLYQREQIETIELMTFIPDLVTEVLRSYQLNSVRVSYDLDDLSVSVDKAITLALMLNELTTNACKYSLNQLSDPALEIACHLVGQEVTVLFKDNGPGLVFPVPDNSFGLKLIRILTQRLKGKSHFANDSGLSFHLSFSLGRKDIGSRKELVVS